jgi:hypothetical protein
MIRSGRFSYFEDDWYRFSRNSIIGLMIFIAFIMIVLIWPMSMVITLALELILEPFIGDIEIDIIIFGTIFSIILIPLILLIYLRRFLREQHRTFTGSKTSYRNASMILRGFWHPRTLATGNWRTILISLKKISAGKTGFNNEIKLY